MNHKNRSWCLVLLVCAAFPVIAATAADLSRRMPFDISPQPLATALLRFSEQASVQFTAPSASVEGIQSPGVRGKYAPDAALKLLLRGTGLMFEFVGDSTISIRQDTAQVGKSARPQAAPPSMVGASESLRVAQLDDAQARTLAVSSDSAADAAAGPNRPSNIEEIVVTATKRAIKLQDVPVAVSVLTSENIVERGFTEYGNYLNSLPGVHFADGGPGRSVIRIRGLSASEGAHATLVATYFGETPTSVQGTFPNLRLVDIERVEVLRGPQGTLFGANALAGLVRILPAQPDLERYQAAVGVRGFSTAHSDDESYHVEGVVNLPLVEDRFALRLVGFKDDIAGYIDNRFAGQRALDYSPSRNRPPGSLVIPAVASFERPDVNREETVGGRAAATWQATQRLRFELGYATQEVTLESEPHVTPSVDDYAQSRGLDAYSRGEGREEADITNLTVRYDWDTVSFTSATAFSNFDERTFTDVTETTALLLGLPLPAEIGSVLESDAFTQELRVQSRGAGPWQWLFGAFYLDRDRSVLESIPDFSCPTCLPTLAVGQDMLLRSRISFAEEQRAAFGEVSYDFSPRWTATAGARWFEQDLRKRVTDISGLLGATQLDTDNRGSVDQFNPAFHLQFRPSDDATLYAQAAKGFRTGAPNNSLPAQCQAEAQARGLKPITDPDTLWNYELGVKSALAGGRLGLNAAVYHGDWSGIQVAAGLACAFNATLNGGDATTRGVELELLAQASDAWRFNLAASYNESEFDKVDPKSGFIDGERIPAAPRTNASAGVQYDFAVGSEWSGFARADYQYVGNIRLISAGLAPRVITQDGYGTGNVRLSFARDNLALEIFARNVTDERGVLFTRHPVFGGDQFIVRPREVGVELRYRYE